MKLIKQSTLFFGRKFDPIFNQDVINFLDEQIYGKLKPKGSNYYKHCYIYYPFI
jgi:hypothetical protein